MVWRRLRDAAVADTTRRHRPFWGYQKRLLWPSKRNTPLSRVEKNSREGASRTTSHAIRHGKRCLYDNAPPCSEAGRSGREQLNKVSDPTGRDDDDHGGRRRQRQGRGGTMETTKAAPTTRGGRRRQRQGGKDEDEEARSDHDDDQESHNIKGSCQKSRRFTDNDIPQQQGQRR